MNYTILPGETLSGIARANGITQKALEKANKHITDPDVIQVGEVITIPDDAVLVSGTSDPATNAAIIASTKPIDSVVEDCPLRDEWFTVKPVRYSVVHNDDAASLPSSLTISVSMPSLKQHKYVARELTDQSVYLFNIDEGYLLEVSYEEGIAESGRCVFGSPPSDVTASLPILKQPKDAKVVMWLTSDPLTELKLTGLASHTSKIASFGQGIDFTSAASGTAGDTRPLYDLESLLAETQGVTLKWTAPFLEPIADINGLKVPYQAQTPDNHYAVCLVDAIGISSDLCREFSLTYQHGIEAIGSAQHPYLMSKMSERIIAKFAHEAGSAYVSPTTVSTSVLDAQGIAGSRTVKRTPEQIAKIRTQRKLAQQQKLQAALHYDEMDQFRHDYQGMTQVFGDTLNNLAEDWLAWLKHDETDKALSWLDDSDMPQIMLKEQLVLAMVSNINVTDTGIALRDTWIDGMLAAVNEQDDKQQKGVGNHVALALGWSSKFFVTGSKWLKELSATYSNTTSPEAIAQSRQDMLNSSQMAATLTTDEFQRIVADSLISKSLAKSGNNEKLWQTYSQIQAQRYGYSPKFEQFAVTTVFKEVQKSFAVQAAAVSGHSISEVGEYTPMSQSETIGLYVLSVSQSQSKLSTGQKTAIWFAKQVEGAVDNRYIDKAYRSTAEVLAPYNGKLLGMFWLVQVYNAYQVFNTSQQSSFWKAGNEALNAFFGLVNSSIAFADNQMERRGLQTVTTWMNNGGADKLGLKTIQGLDDAIKFVGFTALRNNMFDTGLKIATTVYKTGFKALPVIGNFTAVASSFFTLSNDRQQDQNPLAKGVAIASLVTNSLALVCAIGIAVAPITAPIYGVVMVLLVITGLILEGVHSWIEDDRIITLLKGTLWGTGNYRYRDGLASLAERKRFFLDAKPDDKEVAKTLRKEIMTVCDELFRPTPAIIKSVKTDGLIHFTFQLYLPAFMRYVSDVTVLLQGVRSNNKQVLLQSASSQGQWKNNQVNGKLTLLAKQQAALLTFSVDEYQLGVDYQGYTLAIEYSNPSGYPVILSYKIDIDDDKYWFSFWRDEAELSLQRLDSAE